MWEFYIHVAITIAILVADHHNMLKNREDDIFIREQWLEEQQEKGILVDDLIITTPDSTVTDTLNINKEELWDSTKK